MTVVNVVVQFMLFGFTSFASAWLLQRRFAVLQAVGAVLLILSSFTAILLSIYVPRWGVLRIGTQMQLYSVTAVRAAYVAFALLYLLASGYLVRRVQIARRAGSPA